MIFNHKKGSASKDKPVYGVSRKKKSEGAGSSPKNSRSVKIPAFRNPRVALYIFLGIMIFGGVWAGALYMAKNTTIGEVTVRGYHYTDLNDIIETAAIDTGTHADSVNINQVLDRVESLPYIQRASVYISPLGRLELNVTERNPVAILTQGDALALVDRYGIKMPVPESNFPDLPLLFGFNVNPAGDTLRSESFRQAADFLWEVRNRKISGITISEVGWHPEDGVFALSSENGVRLIFGNEDFERRLDYWEEFYRQIVPVRGIHTFTRLDFRFRNQIVARET